MLCIVHFPALSIRCPASPLGFSDSVWWSDTQLSLYQIQTLRYDQRADRDDEVKSRAGNAAFSLMGWGQRIWLQKFQ